MIKLAYNKVSPNLVFEINEVERVAIGNAGVKEYYKGTLVDTSTVPDTHVANYKVQVKAFEMDWNEVPIDLGSTGNINNQTKNVTPKATSQNVTPDTGYTGLDKVVVAATPLEEKTATPAATAVVVTPGTGKVGLSKVTVSAVTAAIDSNIVAGNIKQGVTILGVTGSYTGQ